LRRVLLAAAAALLAAEGAFANVFPVDGRDPRHEQAKDAAPFAAIGQIHNEHPIPVIAEDQHVRYAQGQATAFLVSPCYAVTNFHAVFGEQSARRLRARNYAVTFLAGAGPDGDGFSVKTRATPAFYGDFDEEREGEDWAVLRLDECVGADAGGGWLATGVAQTRAAVGTAGYPASKDGDRLWRQDDCRLTGRADEGGMWLTDCSAEPGSSGSPVFALENGAPRVIGVMEGAEDDAQGLAPYSRRLANLVVDINAVMARPDVKAAIEADRAGGK
jgi:V8-like Glu-specific endopeptidase